MTVKDITNLFRLKNKIIKIRNHQRHNFQSNNYIKYKSNSDRNKTLSVEEHGNKIRPYLKDIINNVTDAWKIQIAIEINFISSKDNDEEHVIHSKNDNIEIIINDKADEVREETSQSLLSSYQTGLKSKKKVMKMKSNDFTFDCIHLLY